MFVWLRGTNRKGQRKEIVPLFHIVPLFSLLNNKMAQKDKNQSHKHKDINQMLEKIKEVICCVGKSLKDECP